jgi:hypothetical protein
MGTDGEKPPAGEPNNGKSEEKTFSQADLDRVVADRLKREQGKYSDYADLKAKASKLDEEKTKSESEKLAERVAAAERRAIEAEAKVLKVDVAREKGIANPRWLSGTTREELEASATEYLSDHPSAANGNGPAPAKPVEDLRGGGEPAEGPDPDIRKIVEAIPRGI